MRGLTQQNWLFASFHSAADSESALINEWRQPLQFLCLHQRISTEPSWAGLQNFGVQTRTDPPSACRKPRGQTNAGSFKASKEPSPCMPKISKKSLVRIIRLQVIHCRPRASCNHLQKVRQFNRSSPGIQNKMAQKAWFELERQQCADISNRSRFSKEFPGKPGDGSFKVETHIAYRAEQRLRLRSNNLLACHSSAMSFACWIFSHFI